jgi:ribonuclease J
MYAAEIIKATGNSNLPQAGCGNLRVFLPASQKNVIKRNGLYDLADSYRSSRIYPEELAASPENFVMLFRPSMQSDLEQAGCLKDAHLIYSMWEGYLREERQRPFLDWLSRYQIGITSCHTSGHASLADLQVYAKAVAPRMLVPIHSFKTERFKEFFDHVEQKEDGQWWEVGHA